ncbi:hypothetical protein [Barrientosiimonas endolithica]|uniref:Uncharacterized protein n=1 Tax=Barrientosiimonas endolithica TaxID=1535208 RepID=A0ABN6YT71_9MICO|nr:hypothetical protein [Barrientosiimonas endolithica]BDZ58908.1 hypothetical protein GCM10025872_25650 [Barrientosiimonas endolithica]
MPATTIHADASSGSRPDSTAARATRVGSEPSRRKAGDPVVTAPSSVVSAGSSRVGSIATTCWSSHDGNADALVATGRPASDSSALSASTERGRDRSYVAVTDQSASVLVVNRERSAAMRCSPSSCSTASSSVPPGATRRRIPANVSAQVSTVVSSDNTRVTSSSATTRSYVSAGSGRSARLPQTTWASWSVSAWPKVIASGIERVKTVR